MKISSLVLAATMLAAMPVIAGAQTATPQNQSGPGISPTAPGGKDPALGIESGNVKGKPSQSAVPGGANNTSTTGSGMKSNTTGNMGTPGANNNEGRKDSMTPGARPNEGSKKQ